MRKTLAALTAFLLIFSITSCTFGVDENYALDALQWSEADGAKTVSLNDGGINGYVKYYVDEANRTIYVNINYCTESFKEENNRIYVTVNTQNSARTAAFAFDENGYCGEDNSDFRLVQRFGEATEYGQEITFAFQYVNRGDFSDNQLSISVFVNDVGYKVLDCGITLLSATTTKATTQRAAKTTKSTTAKETTVKQKTTKAAGSRSTTKFTPPVGADYFAEGGSETDELTSENEYSAEQIVEAPVPELRHGLSNEAKIILACAAVLAVVGAGLLAKAAVAAKNKRAEKQNAPQAKEAVIDEESKEIIDRYIDDEYEE